jgi:hypothetical protein
MPDCAAAALILAHSDPTQVARVIEVMAPMPVFLHCDERTPRATLEAMVAGSSARVRVLPRMRTTLSSWSLVAAELAGVRTIIDQTDAQHVVVMSGSCYPVVPDEVLLDTLDAHRGQSLLSAKQLPMSEWNTERNRDGGLWRFNRRFVTFRDQVVVVRGVPLRTHRRRIPEGLRLHGGSEWKVYSREHAISLLHVIDANPTVREFFRHSFIPDESCVPSILRSPELVGSVVDDVILCRPWYFDFDLGAYHPRSLDDRSFDAIRLARDEDGCLFARKISSSASSLLDRIDSELRA